MRYRWIAGLLVVIAMAASAAGLAAAWNKRNATPATLTGPNLLPNNDFATDADADGLPDGWRTPGAGGVQLGEFTVDGTGRSLQISGINNYAASPVIAARPGARYRVAFRALADNPERPSPTRVRVRFHWIDAEGAEFSNLPGTWQAVPHRAWALVSDAAVAPPEAAQLSISLHVASDDRIVVDELQLGQVGVRINPWPDGKRAALALSFDYETAMGGLIHSRSVDDPYAAGDPLDRAHRMRAGAEEIIRLFEPAGIRGTWYTNGYNFLAGNRDRRLFMGNPIYRWATTENHWPTSYWATTPWFARDPYSDEATDPEWYFGSQIPMLKAAGQDIQSHTFAHFDGGLVTPDDWRADFAAWKDVAAPLDVSPATSLAFPWSSSAGMRWDSWEVLAANGIRSVTRTNWSQPRYRIADRETYAVRTIPGHEQIAVIGDEYLTPSSLPRVRQRLDAALLNEGAIDVWAHTEEVTSPEQRAAWQSIIAARDPFWVAPVPEITTWHAALAHVSIRLRAETPQYVFQVANANPRPLAGLTLVLPFAPARAAVDGRAIRTTGNRLVMDVPARGAVEVTLWPV